MADFQSGLGLMRGLQAVGMAGPQDSGQSGLPLAGMASRMTPEELEAWRRRMSGYQTAPMGGQPGIGFAGAGNQNMAPWLAMGAANPGLAQFLMGLR